MWRRWRGVGPARPRAGGGAGRGMPGELREAAVDLLRVVAVGMVVLGHWLASSVVYRAGHFEHENVLGSVSWVPWLTLVFQVMPVLFLVGGYANGVSWMRHRAGGGEWSTWLHRRAVRLLVPTTVYVGAGVLAVAACLAAGMDRSSLQSSPALRFAARKSWMPCSAMTRAASCARARRRFSLRGELRRGMAGMIKARTAVRSCRWRGRPAFRSWRGAFRPGSIHPCPRRPRAQPAGPSLH